MTKKKKLISLDDAVIEKRHEDVSVTYRPGRVTEVRRIASTWHFSSEGQVHLGVTVLAGGIFKMSYHPGVPVREFSYAIAPGFRPEKARVQFSETAASFLLATKEGSCEVRKRDMRVRFRNAKGKIICEETTPFFAQATLKKGFVSQRVRFKAKKGERYFGLGDKTGRTNLRGRRLTNWNTDEFAFGVASDPIYRSVPFYYGVTAQVAYGVFLDNTGRTHFDFDSKRKGVVELEAESGPVVYYFLFGPQPEDVLRRYMRLTGTAPLPPIWALGFHQCRWSYFPQEHLVEVAKEFRRRRIPCDAIYLDIDYMDAYQCFTWNKEAFPDFRQLPRRLGKQGFKLILMIDPGLKADVKYPVFREALTRGYLCRRSDGSTYLGPVWPGLCGFPDYTSREVRQWWGELYEEFYLKMGYAGFWNDMNEPAVFFVDTKTMPADVMHACEGLHLSHRRVHNIYGMQMSRASFEGLRRFAPERRPFLLVRATFAGGQRYAAVWTGDNVATWEHLRLANIQVQRLNISGMVFCGSDIGGFAGRPDGELMVRWLQMGAFHPFFRVHSMGNHKEGDAPPDAETVLNMNPEERMDQEPWSFGEPFTSHAREAIELRYRFLPLLYTAFYLHSQDGRPIVMPLPFYDASDPKCDKYEQEFIFAGRLLVAPVTKAGLRQMTVYLPAGDWYDLHTGKRYQGRRTVRIKTDLSRIPLFGAAGTVLPEYPIMNYTGERPVEVLTLNVFPGTGESFLYEDAGDGYEEGCLQRWILAENGKQIVLLRKQKGSFRPDYDRIKLRIYGANVEQVLMGRKKLELHHQAAYVEVRVPATFRKIVITQK